MARRLYGDWDKAQGRLVAMVDLSQKNMRLANKRNAIGLRDAIKKTIRDGRPEWPPNSPLTTANKGSSKPLVDHNDMTQSITALPISKDDYWIGVPSYKKNKSGIGMSDIATVHEFGAEITPKRGRALAIPLSKKARRLAAANGGVRNIPGLFRLPGTRVLAIGKGNRIEILFALMAKVKIPARPFIGTTYHDYLPTMEERQRDAARATMRGEKYRPR